MTINTIRTHTNTYQVTRDDNKVWAKNLETGKIVEETTIQTKQDYTDFVNTLHKRHTLPNQDIPYNWQVLDYDKDIRHN